MEKHERCTGIIPPVPREAGGFINFDIIEFYPSITENVLRRAFKFARLHTEIQDCEIDTIMHAKRTIVFSNGEPWKKKNNNTGFDITMGSLDGAESCELAVAYMVSLLQSKYEKSIGLYIYIYIYI